MPCAMARMSAAFHPRFGPHPEGEPCRAWDQQPPGMRRDAASWDYEPRRDSLANGHVEAALRRAHTVEDRSAGRRAEGPVHQVHADKLGPHARGLPPG